MDRKSKFFEFQKFMGIKVLSSEMCKICFTPNIFINLLAFTTRICSLYFCQHILNDINKIFNSKDYINPRKQETQISKIYGFFALLKIIDKFEENIPVVHFIPWRILYRSLWHAFILKILMSRKRGSLEI